MLYLETRQYIILCFQPRHCVELKSAKSADSRFESLNEEEIAYWRDDKDSKACFFGNVDPSQSSKHWLTGFFSLPNKFLNFFVRSSLFDFVLDNFFKFDFLEILAIFIEWKVLAVNICLGFRRKFIRPRWHFLVKHYPLHTAKYATGFLISDWLSSLWHGIDIYT